MFSSYNAVRAQDPAPEYPAEIKGTHVMDTSYTHTHTLSVDFEEGYTRNMLDILYGLYVYGIRNVH